MTTMKPKRYEAIGKQIQQLRRRTGLSQPKAATAMGVATITLRGWESGRRVPKLHDAARLARVLGCRIDDLLPAAEATPTT